MRYGLRCDVMKCATMGQYFKFMPPPCHMLATLALSLETVAAAISGRQEATFGHHVLQPRATRPRLHVKPRNRGGTDHGPAWSSPNRQRDPRPRQHGCRAHAQVHHQLVCHRRMYPAKLTRLLALKSGYSPSLTARSTLAHKHAAI